jgi:hypothetical protein
MDSSDQSEARFVYRPSSRVAHVWVGEDTACRMWSTGGLRQHKFVFAEDAGGRETCNNCKNCACESDESERMSHLRSILTCP